MSEPLDLDAIERELPWAPRWQTVTHDDALALLAECRRLRAEHAALWDVAEAAEAYLYVEREDGTPGEDAPAYRRLWHALAALPPRAEKNRE